MAIGLLARATIKSLRSAESGTTEFFCYDESSRVEFALYYIWSVRWVVMFDGSAMCQIACIGIVMLVVFVVGSDVDRQPVLLGSGVAWPPVVEKPRRIEHTRQSMAAWLEVAESAPLMVFLKLIFMLGAYQGLSVILETPLSFSTPVNHF